MKTTIRIETPQDYSQVETITRKAFWNLYQQGCNEHLIVHNLRTHPDFIPELTLVIEFEGKIVGSIFYSHSKVVDRDEREIKTITFGPVSITPELHRKGLGRELITHSISKAKELGYGAIIIGGYPYHYQPYGFVGAKKYHIALPDGEYYTGIMALPLIEGYLDNIDKGVVYFSDVMDVDESNFDEFDAHFEPMAKQITPSQKEFEIAVSNIDTNQY